MIKQTKIVDAVSHDGVHVSFLSDGNFIANTDCCEVDTSNPEESAMLTDVLQELEKKFQAKIDNCKTLRRQLESQIADYIFTELPPPVVYDPIYFRGKNQTLGSMLKTTNHLSDFIHCENCDEPGTHSHFNHPSEDSDPEYLCDRCFAGETHE